MDKSESLKLLASLEEQFNEAKKKPDMNLHQMRQLYFELQCLRKQLLNMNEKELEPLN